MLAEQEEVCHLHVVQGVEEAVHAGKGVVEGFSPVAGRASTLGKEGSDGTLDRANSALGKAILLQCVCNQHAVVDARQWKISWNLPAMNSLLWSIRGVCMGKMPSVHDMQVSLHASKDLHKCAGNFTLCLGRLAIFQPDTRSTSSKEVKQKGPARSAPMA